MSVDKQQEFAKVLNDLSVRPWLVAEFRDNPIQILKEVPGLTGGETQGVARGHKGMIYRLLCFPFWAEIRGRIPSGYDPDMAVALHENDQAHDVDQMDHHDHDNVDIDVDSNQDHDHNVVGEADFVEHDLDDPDSRKGVVGNVKRKLDESIKWFDALQKRTDRID